jgi:hypothetical protein
MSLSLSILMFTEAKIEALAEMEHDRWMAERLLNGWIHSEHRDPDKKISPYLVP